jgi:hypothetical protein
MLPERRESMPSTAEAAGRASGRYHFLEWDQNRGPIEKCLQEMFLSFYCNPSSLFFALLHNLKFTDIPYPLSIYTHLLIFSTSSKDLLAVDCVDSFPWYRRGLTKVCALPQSCRAYAQTSKVTLDKRSPFNLSSALRVKIRKAS